MASPVVAQKRLMKEMKAMGVSPVEGIGAMPLEDNIMEWHCNIKFEDVIYHLILFFPDTYPGTSPSAEFLPMGLQFGGGASKRGRKGMQVCLSIFSDFKSYHPEWEHDSHAGWSPAYTVEKILLNLVSFMEEHMSSRSGGAFVPGYNKRMTQEFKCPDCGHCGDTPVPEIHMEPDSEAGDTDAKATADGEDGAAKVNTGEVSPAGDPGAVGGEPADTAEPEEDEIQDTFPITCYMLLTEITPIDEAPEDESQLFGFGMNRSGNDQRPRLTSPCEYLSKTAFDHSMRNLMRVLTSYRDEIHYFLPLYIHANHATKIKVPFEEVIKKINTAHHRFYPGGYKCKLEDQILRLLTSLMVAAVVDFSKGRQATSDNHMSGYFVLHRLLLWAIDTYPDLQDVVEERIQTFRDEETNRMKKACPDIGEWLTLLSVSRKHSWSDVASVYLCESARRHVQWGLKDCPALENEHMPQAERLSKTFVMSRVGNRLLAFQVAFLDVAWPQGKTREEVILRYDANMGRPTSSMIRRMKASTARVEKIQTYNDWYPAIKVPCPSDDDLCQQLMEAMKFAQATEGYFFTTPPGDGDNPYPPRGGRGGRGRGRGRGRGGNQGRGRRNDVLMDIAANLFD